MDPVAHLEIVDRRGRVERRFPLERLPAVIGRGLDCDVIVDDPFVCRAHLRIDEREDGTLEAVDLESVNGTRRRGSRQVEPQIPLDADTVLRVGRTCVRVRRPDAPVEKARRDLRRGPAAVWSSRLAALLVVALGTGGIGVQSYLDTYRRSTTMDLASNVLLIVSGLGIWAGCWALANRMIRGDFRFATHWAIACVAACGIWVLFDLLDAAWFLFSFDDTPIAASFLIFSLLGTAVLVAHVSVFSQMGRLRRIWACALAVVPMVAILEFADYAGNQHFDAQLHYSGEIAPVSADWAPAVSLSRYYDQLDGIRAEVDALAAEEEG